MYIAIDTETDKYKKPFLISTCDSNIVSNLYYPDKESDYSYIKDICSSRKVSKVFHNAVFDIYALSLIDIEVVRPYHDTMVMASLLNENYSPKKLKYLAKVFLKEETNEAKELNKIKAKYKKLYGKDFGFDKLPLEVIKPYAAKDAEYTMQLFNMFKEPIDSFEYLYRLEIKLVPILVDMVKRGLIVDRDFCKSEIKHLSDLYSIYSGKVFSSVGKIFNINSSDEIRNILKDRDIRVKNRTKKGKISTAKEDLLSIKDDTFNNILKMRSIDKQINTYYEPLLNNYTTETDTAAHFTLYQSGAKTGRFSADLVQTIPNKVSVSDSSVINRVRGAFIVREGFTNVYMDYSQIEMRLFAHFSNDKTLITAINNDVDAHYDTACNLFGKDVVDANKKYYRSIAKGINFGIIYGMGKQSLAETLGLSLYEANKALKEYYSKYRVREFVDEVTSELYKKGFITLSYVNRIYRIPKHMAYKGVNALIQGAAAYVIKLAMIRLAKYLKQFNGLINLLLTVHDELVFEIHNSLNVVAEAKKLHSIMEDRETFKVPITASIMFSTTSWLNKYELNK